MGNSKIDMNILAKRVELLEMRVKELTSVEPEALNERLSKIEERYFSNKEMLTTTEVAEYLGVSQSQIYKLTMNMEIPHYQATGQNHLFRQEGTFEMDAQQPYHPGTKGQRQQIEKRYERQKEKQDQSLF